MPIYSYRCRNCSMELDSHEQRLHETNPCPRCNGPLRKQFLVTTQPLGLSIEPHFNYSVGEVVNSWGDFKSKLSVKSDIQTERLGIDHNYQPIHPADLEKPSNMGVKFDD